MVLAVNTMESQNPLLTKDRLKKMLHTTTDVATLDGAINKSIILLMITIAVTAFVWSTASAFGSYLFLALIGSAVLGFACVLALIFKPEWAPVLAPVYAGVEGVFLGLVSMVVEGMYPGIVFQAVLLTFGVAFLMLTLYRTGVIKVTEKFRTVIILATASIMLIYLVGFVMSFFGTGIPYIHESGWIGIAFSLVVVTVASLNLLLDFDLIERTVQEKAPQYMEWIGAFALLVTIIWLYIEIINLLMKIRD
jgi:uncharacterized YccA/Bax inhibitor family protein